MTISIQNRGGLAAKLRQALTRDTTTCQPGERRLEVGAVWSCDLRAGQGIVCRTGTLWLTQSGDATDTFLRAGQGFTAPRRGRVVVQALEAGALSLTNWER